MTTSYITPITDRTYDDVLEARENQADLTTHNKGAWNYTDANRVGNNILYAAEWMYEQGFFSEPYTITGIKTNWTETDIITYEELNTIITVINNLKSYSRSDLVWYPLYAVANIDYNTANWIELDIDALATQEPLPEDTFELTVENGSGSGYYEAYTVVTISADIPDTDLVFSYWSGDHLENIESATASITTYTMPYDDVTLTANYAGTVEHTLTVITNSGTETAELLMGATYSLVADPAPAGKVFWGWTVSPEDYESYLYEPAASTTFSMPNEAVTITAIYITPGEKVLTVYNGSGSGSYEYNTKVNVYPDIPSGSVFTNWSGTDAKYLSYDSTESYNIMVIPDKTPLTIRANYYTPPATGVEISMLGGSIYSVNGSVYEETVTSGLYTQGDVLEIISEEPEEANVVFDYWSVNEGDGLITDSNQTSDPATVTVSTQATEIDGNYRNKEWHTLTVTTNSGTTVTTYEAYDIFTINAEPCPDGYVFVKWSGDIQSGSTSVKTYPFVNKSTASTYMGTSDRTIEAVYRKIVTGVTLTVVQPSGETTYIYPEFSTITIKADDPEEGQKLYSWYLNPVGVSFSNYGSISDSDDTTITYTFGGDDAILTNKYRNVWDITISEGYLVRHASKYTHLTLFENTSISIVCRDLDDDEYFLNWFFHDLSPNGTIHNTAAMSTTFTVGNGADSLVANIGHYSDKTLTVYFQDPDTNTLTLISKETYTHGSYIVIEAPTAPVGTTFLSWLGDVAILSPNALASSAIIRHLTQDTVITATYYYPEATGSYLLTVYNGTPESELYAAGTQIAITANEPADEWEFYKWIGDTAYLVNSDLTSPTNTVLMPKQAVTLYAKYKVIGEDPIYRIVVNGGTAEGTYTDSEGITHTEGPSTIIDVPAGIEIELVADDDTTDYVFDHWSGNFAAAGVTDIVLTNSTTYFTMVEADLNITMVRTLRDQYTVYGTNCNGFTGYPGTYDLYGTLTDTDDYHYVFTGWTCVDANGYDYSSAIADINDSSTQITLTDKSLFVEAHYTTYYKLTVVNGQDTGSGYYYEGETVNSVYANDAPDDTSMFNYWEDPIGVISSSINVTNPTITMKNSIATITAVYTSIESSGNSIALISDEITDDNIISKSNSSLINGLFTTGTLLIDGNGDIGIITDADVDNDSYTIKKLFYGGNN